MPLSENLVKDAIVLHLQAESWTEVVKVLGEKLEAAGYVKDSYTCAVIEREKTLPTGLPLGGNYDVAIPHTDVIHVLKPGIAFATLEKPVNFQNMVDPSQAVPVSLVFMLALSEPHAQVIMLQEIAGVFQDLSLVESLMQLNDPAEVLTLLKR